MPDDKIRAYDLGLTVTYPYATILSTVPVPTSPGVPGGVYTPTGEGKLSQGDFTQTLPTFRLSLVPGTLQTTKQDSRNALVRFGAFAELSQWRYRQTATTQIGEPTTSRLEAEGYQFAIGAYLRSAYLVSNFTEPDSIPPALNFVRIEILPGIGFVPMSTRVIQPSGGEDKANVLPLTFDTIVRVGVIGIDTGPLHIGLASETKVSLQTTQLNNGGTREAYNYINTGAALSVDGEF